VTGIICIIVLMKWPTTELPIANRHYTVYRTISRLL